MLRSATTLSVVGLLLLACNSDSEERFLPLADVCRFYTEEACAAQDSCCDGAEGDAGATACAARVLASCNDQLDALTNEGALSYDGKAAAAELDQLRSELDACDDPGTPARFFQGGKARGDACERASECASFVCEAAVCASAEAEPLCAL